MFAQRYVFRPTRDLELTPTDVGLRYEDAAFTADGHRLHGWLIPGRRPATVLVFHGNAGNMGHYCEYLRFLHHGLGVTLAIFDYRGYGPSEGAPSERGLYRDAEAAVRWLASDPTVAAQPLVYFGHSLGSAVAVEMALRRPPAGLVLEAPFLSVPAMAAALRGRWAVPLAVLLGARFDSLGKISRVFTPLLVIHGEADETVPLAHGLRLFDAANEPKTLLTVPKGGHKDAYLVGGQAYVQSFVRFIDALQALGPSPLPAPAGA